LYKQDTSISYYRNKANLSQQKLADILNIPRTTMSFYENKRQYPSIEEAEQIAEILQVPIGSLYSQEELALMRARSLR
jgi:DNA-binding XRE family transcriptional regulator